MFDTFGEYMHYLLPSPMKRGAQAVSQFWRWCKAMGQQVDGLQQDVFTVREQSMIQTASAEVLSLHGIDRRARRLRGETLENYRMRLMLHTRIAEQAGTNQAIYYVARSFGYDNVTITRNPDPAHWAEATVALIGGSIVVDDRDLLLAEVNRVKPASALLTLTKEQRYPAGQYFGSMVVVGKILTIW